MKKDYTNYTAEQLLQDEFFIESIQHPTEETDRFWQGLVEEKVISQEELAIARSFLRSLQIEKKRMSSRENTVVWKKIQNSNTGTPGKRLIPSYKVWAAASVAILIGCGIFFTMIKESPDNSLREMARVIKPDTEITDVQLVLSDNERISIQDEKIDIQYDNKGEITVNEKKIEQETNTASAKQKIPANKKFNQLLVAKGKRSTLTFSDGTVLWVNAGSRVVYPEQFDEKKREIYVDGEAYLQVSPDPSRPFVVKTRQMDISVLGTSFNVSAYEEDDWQAVALVEGKVEITSGKEKLAQLSPDDLFRYKDGHVTVEKTDVSDYTSWIDGWYIFQSEQLPIILDKLSRYYGENINYNKDIEWIKCSGKLDLKDELSKVLNALIETAPITYKKQENTYNILLSTN